jgi:DNA-binding NarL/FixJ family response regulator
MRIAVLDRDPMFIAGTSELGERINDFQLAGTGTSEADALEICQHADVVLLDWAVSAAPEELIVKLLSMLPGIAIVVSSDREQAGVARAAFRAGALGYVPKTCTSESIAYALRQASKGASWLPPATAARVLSDPVHGLIKPVEPLRAWQDSCRSRMMMLLFPLSSDAHPAFVTFLNCMAVA